MGELQIIAETEFHVGVYFTKITVIEDDRYCVRTVGISKRISEEENLNLVELISDKITKSVLSCIKNIHGGCNDNKKRTS